jgi:hypothetical protein
MSVSPLSFGSLAWLLLRHGTTEPRPSDLSLHHGFVHRTAIDSSSLTPGSLSLVDLCILSWFSQKLKPVPATRTYVGTSAKSPAEIATMVSPWSLILEQTRDLYSGTCQPRLSLFFFCSFSTHDTFLSISQRLPRLPGSLHLVHSQPLCKPCQATTNSRETGSRKELPWIPQTTKSV